ncbi:MAG TPA: EpsI family protein [Pyrinomonadaceae bacterium]|nr:EpsI family protein [Pyrinomonadaceae bacterium]
MKKGRWHYWVLLAALVACGALIHAWERSGEARAARRELKEFPAEVGAWRQRGADMRFDAATESVLRASDYVTRNYASADGRGVNFYVGYYSTQRTGATYHSPLNCLPGSGWTLNDPATVRITPAGGGEPFEANRYVIQNGDERHLLVYWYQGRGRAVASEYWDKVFTVWDSVRLRRSDGAMVRVLVPFNNSEEAALAAATDFAAQAAPHLRQFVPE